MIDGRPEALVVDDTEDFRVLATIALQAVGFTVVTVGNGAEALDYLHSHAAPAVIVLDLKMPVMDGLGFLKVKSAEPAIAAIPVVLYTSEPERVRAAGVADQVAKGTGGTKALVEAVTYAIKH